MNPFGVLPTLISTDRLCNIIRYSEMVKELEGDCAIAGVFKGGCVEVIAKFNPHKTVWAFDSFEGMPESSDKDPYHKKGDFSEVEYGALYGYFKILYRNVELRKGYFADTFPKMNPYKKYSLVHIDCDLYDSVKCALDYFYPRMVEGGVIICDDIGWESVAGGEQALMEFVDTINPTYKGEIFYYPNKSNKQYLIIK